MSSLRFVSWLGASAFGIALLLGACSSQSPQPVESLGRVQAAATLTTPGFVETTVIDGLNAPTVVRFAKNGRVIVGEKGGKIWSYDDLDDATPSLLLDLSVGVHNFWDRGLLGLALDPDFPTNPYLYVLYAFDGDPGSAAPKWEIPVPIRPAPPPTAALSPGACRASA